MEELKEMELLDEGETVDIPDLEIEDLIEENSLSVIVRCLNPFVHKVGGLVKALPPIWGMEERVRGRGVGEDRVQGLPIHMPKKQVVECLLDPLGKVEKVELHAKNSNSLEYIRVLVHISTEEPLQFRRTARFKSGTTIPMELEYEKLLKVCYTCKRLTHDQSRCPQQIVIAPVEERGTKGRKKEQSLRKKLSEKELKAKEALQKQTAKGVVLKEPRGGAGPSDGKSKAYEALREEKRKGKRVVSTPQIQWRQKHDSG
ncbi:unnamed protein product, partial [Brassica napus]